MVIKFVPVILQPTHWKTVSFGSPIACLHIERQGTGYRFQNKTEQPSRAISEATAISETLSDI